MIDISVISLPPSRWQQAKSLRLEALQNDPIAFGSSDSEESEFDDSVWQRRLATAFNRENNITLYAESDGKLIGMMGAGWSNRIKNRHVATIYGVYVTPPMRGHGVGSQLLQSLLTQLENIEQIERIELTVTVDQLAAVALYEKCGFQKIGIAHKVLKISDTYYDIYHMEKLL